MDILDDRDQTASPSILTERPPHLCPLCGTHNHALSRECFNCGWRGAFLWGNAVSHQARPQCVVKIPLVPLWWNRLKTWLLIQHRTR